MTNVNMIVEILFQKKKYIYMLNQRSFYGSSWRLEHVISSMEHEYDTSIRGERKLLHTIIPLIQLT